MYLAISQQQGYQGFFKSKWLESQQPAPEKMPKEPAASTVRITEQNRQDVELWPHLVLLERG